MLGVTPDRFKVAQRGGVLGLYTGLLVLEWHQNELQPELVIQNDTFNTKMHAKKHTMGVQPSRTS